MYPAPNIATKKKRKATRTNMSLFAYLHYFFEDFRIQMNAISFQPSHDCRLISSRSKSANRTPALRDAVTRNLEDVVDLNVPAVNAQHLTDTHDFARSVRQAIHVDNDMDR